MENKKILKDKRITSIILSHWEELRGNRLFPSEDQLNADILESVLDNCYVVDAKEIENSEKYKYKYIGQNIIDAYASDLTSNPNSDDPLSHRNKILTVIETKRPIIEEGKFVNKKGQLVKYRQCLIPLGKQDNMVESVLGGLRFLIDK